MSIAQRKFFGEVARFLETSVVALTIDGKSFTGTLVGINPETLSVCLEDVKDEKGKPLHRLLLNGSVIAQIFAGQKPFDLKALAERLEKVFPTMVRLYEDKGLIWVMDKVKITAKGVEEGSGPAAERVRKVYDHFLSEMKD